MTVEEALEPGTLGWNRRSKKYSVEKCKWCGFERALTRGKRFCSNCRLNAKGEKYDIVLARRNGVKPRHRMKLTKAEIKKYVDVIKKCPKCGVKKDVLEGFRLRRNHDPRTGKTYSMPRVYCRVCDGKATYQRQLNKRGKQ
jgi:hypothetical protein